MGPTGARIARRVQNGASYLYRNWYARNVQNGTSSGAVIGMLLACRMGIVLVP